LSEKRRTLEAQKEDKQKICTEDPWNMSVAKFAKLWYISRDLEDRILWKICGQAHKMTLTLADLEAQHT
jgi:hypothetical protein